MKKIFILGNGTEWCEKSIARLISFPDVYFINKRLPVFGKIKTTISRVHFCYKINKIIKLPLKKVWYKNIYKWIKNNSDLNDEIVLLIYDHNVFGAEKSFIDYIRNKLNNVKLVYMFTNIVKYTSAMEKQYVLKLNEWYDVVLAFDKKDAENYNFIYSPLIYDADDNYVKDSNQEIKVFYVGQAKDRIDTLISAYEKLKELNIKCDFYITNVKDEDTIKKYQNEICFNKNLSYYDVVEKIKDATCLIDVIQGDSTGLTIKVCEAVCYDKKLITTNKHVKEYPFYDPRYIRVMESIDDIDLEFFNENKDAHYSKEGKDYFSADSFWNRLWNAL